MPPTPLHRLNRLAAQLSTSSTTTSSTAKMSLKLYTAGTPNGVKASVLLEELKAVGAIASYEHQGISFQKGEQKEDWFLAINPNGRIPALVDSRPGHPKGPINVWESASILLYLQKTYDTKFDFSFQDADDETEMINWIFFVQGGVGPMQGQANHFFRYAPEKIPYGIKRYQDETRRLYTVYEDHLANGNREFLVGSGVGKYSLADICTFPWIRIHDWSGISLTADEYPHLHAWLERIVARPAVKLGLDIPHKDPMEETKDPATAEERAKEASRWIMEGVKREQEALAAKAAAKAKKA